MANRAILEISPSDESDNLFFIYEDGQNVLHKDALRFGMSKVQKIELLDTLFLFCESLKTEGERKTVAEFESRRVLKKLIRDKRAMEFGRLWEIRSDKHGGRIVFVLDANDSVVVSAVNKSVRSKSGDVQTQAIHRGLNRWEALFKN